MVRRKAAFRASLTAADEQTHPVYGDIEGSRKGHNTKHRGKKGLRPILIFLEETREYLCGTQRQGSTMRDEELAKLIRGWNYPGFSRESFNNAVNEYLSIHPNLTGVKKKKQNKPKAHKCA
jgi:hypothetical protein